MYAYNRPQFEPINSIESSEKLEASDIDNIIEQANQGDLEAQLILGACYEEGKGVERNLEKSAQLFSQAAEQGDARAQMILEPVMKKEKALKEI